MHDYLELKLKHGTKVSQTVDSPIMIFDFWELSDGILALFIVLVFGILFYSWGVMILLLIMTLVVGPTIKKRNSKGIYLHWPYRKFGISLPGLMNPRGRRKFSD